MNPEPHNLSIPEFSKLLPDDLFNLLSFNMTRIAYKNWGHRTTLFKDDDKQVDLCYILKNGRSSVHHHSFLINSFNVLFGELDIYCEGELRPLSPEKTRQLVILPGMQHNFHAKTNVILLEVYYLPTPELIETFDIVRVNGSSGGIIEDSDSL